MAGTSGGFSPLDDPLSVAPPAGPTLDLASVPPPRRRQSLNRAGQPRAQRHSSAPPAPPPERLERNHGLGGTLATGVDPAPQSDPRAAHRQRLQEINGYGPPPGNLLQIVPYFVRVFLRKRVVADELAQLTGLRQKADAEVDDLACRIGETLYLRRADPHLAALAQHIAVVGQADSQVDVRQAKSDDAQREATRMLEDVHQRLSAAERAGEPIARRREKLEQQAAGIQGRAAAAQEALRKHDYDLQRLKAKKQPSPDDLIAQQRLETQRVKMQGEVQSTELLLQPVRAELKKLDAKQAKHDTALNALEAERRQLEGMIEREQRQHARQAGTARSELNSALRSLAKAAIAKGLVQHVQDAVLRLDKLEADAKRKRAREGLQREALSSFDEAAYRQGMIALVGGTSALFLVVLLQIAL